MARQVRTPGGLKALETRIGLDAMLAARVGGAQVRRVMTAGRRGRERQEGRTFVDETGAASWEGKPLKGRTPRALAGRNKPARLREEETGVGVRNLVAGTYRVRQTRGEWTPVADGAVGAETPGKGPGPRGHPAGCVGQTLEGSKTSGEDSRVVQTARRGESEEDLKAGRAGRIPWRQANGVEERAKPIRRYDDSLIKL
jgi:hypothetical protein